jgi:hypothetical protein
MRRPWPTGGGGAVTPKTNKTENIEMTEATNTFLEGRILASSGVWDWLDTRAGVETLDKSWISYLCCQLDQNSSIFQPAAQALARSHYPGTLRDSYVHACRRFDKKCVTSVSPTGKGLTITPTAWQNLYFKDQITTVGLSGINLQI